MPLKVKISNLNKKRKFNKAVIKRKALTVLKAFNKKNALIDITFVTDKKIKALNKKYMSRNRETDVLSFSFVEKMLSGKNIFGDIYISSDRAAFNARRFGSIFDKELLLYVIHGILHVLGFGDKTKKEKKLMRKLEERFLKKLWKSKHLSRA